MKPGFLAKGAFEEIEKNRAFWDSMSEIEKAGHFETPYQTG